MREYTQKKGNGHTNELHNPLHWKLVKRKIYKNFEIIIDLGNFG